MSSIYITEPVTSGKVILHTSVGPLDIELWPKEAPKATRNFVQLCLEGYYNGTIFHRISKNFVVQGGDPTGTGTGGESIYGPKGFPDEFHSRLRFTHRGLIACASFEPNQNGSQFFMTLDKTPELDKKNTIFGKIVGDTIYNLVKMNDLEVEDNERPVYPPKIISTEVVWNPFDDIVPRVLDRPRPMTELPDAQKQKKQSKARAIKSKSLLSFGGEEEEQAEEEDGSDAPFIPTRMISIVEAMETDGGSSSGGKSRNKRRKLNEDEAGAKTSQKAKEDDKKSEESAADNREDEEEEVERKRPSPAKRASADSDSDDVDSEEEREAEKRKKMQEEQQAQVKKLQLSGAASSRAAFLQQRAKTQQLSKEEKERLALEKLQKFSAGAAKKKDTDWRAQPLKFEKEDEEALKRRLEAEADTLVVIDDMEEQQRKDKPREQHYMNEHERKLRAQKSSERW